MSLRAELTEAAKEDLLAIWIAYSEYGLSAADRLLSRIHARIELLRDQPDQGERDERVGGVRRVIEGQYLIFYRSNKTTLLVLRIYHSARRIEDITFPDEIR